MLAGAILGGLTAKSKFPKNPILAEVGGALAGAFAAEVIHDLTTGIRQVVIANRAEHHTVNYVTETQALPPHPRQRKKKRRKKNKRQLQTA
jgi:hypothetical protein